MADQPSMVVRISGNIDDLKKSLSDGQAVIDGATVSIEKLGVSLGTNVHQQVQKFDNILASLGINIGNDARAIGELTSASGQTATSLGSVATAGLAAGAAFAGWKIGRVVSDFFDLDKVIGDATAKLLGWGDVVGEQAAAKADVLAKASKTAGIAITDMELAMAINEGTAKSNAEAWNTSANRLAGWRMEIAKVKSDGNFDHLMKDVASQNFDLKELSDRYHVSVEAIQFYAREAKKADDVIIDSNQRKLAGLKEAIAAHREQTEKAEQLNIAMTHLAFAQGNYSTTLEQTDPILLGQIQKYKDLGLSVEDMSTILGVAAPKIELISTALEHQNDALDEADKKWKALAAAQAQSLDEMAASQKAAAAKAPPTMQELANKAASGPPDLPHSFSKNYDLSTDSGRRQFWRENPGARLDAPASYFRDHTMADAIADGYLDLYAWWRLHPLGALVGFNLGPMTGMGPTTGYADGGTNIPGGFALVGERGPEIVNLPGGSDVIPNHMLGGTTTIVNNVNVHGAVLGTQLQLAELVGEAIMAQLRGQGSRFAVRS